jgi:crossover junction endodeoxyribonuclease RuvC
MQPKEQVAAMLQSLLKFKETPDFLDATDGLAVAVCHSFQRIPTTSGKSAQAVKKHTQAGILL